MGIIARGIGDESVPSVLLHCLPRPHIDLRDGRGRQDKLPDNGWQHELRFPHFAPLIEVQRRHQLRVLRHGLILPGANDNRGPEQGLIPMALRLGGSAACEGL